MINGKFSCKLSVIRIDKYCKDISPRNKKKFNQCDIDNNCNEVNIRGKMQKTMKQYLNIDKKTQKLLNKIK